MATESEPQRLPRDQSDRRKRPTSIWDAFRRGGRRVRQRRDEEHRRPYFVDQHSAFTLVLIVLLLGLSIVDAVITLILIGEGGEEINPVMGHLIAKGDLTFLVGKYLLTSAGLPLLLIFKNFYMFGTRFRVGYLLPVFIGLYLILVTYQLFLLHG